jgi:maltooligosyltrehalose trehalohydrolase
VSAEQGRSFPLRVWAPNARRVEGVIDGTDERIALEEVGGGWWLSELTVAQGTDYWFSLDGGEMLPSPRSRWQPSGVDGPSRIVDPASFAWTDQAWQTPPLSSAVIYEAHVGTFSAEGTYEGALRHLDHLVDLGITHLELMPVNQFSGRHGWGYDGVELYAPHNAYGPPAALAGLVNACHERGLGVILDVVYNHLGPSGNHLARFGPYFSDRYRTLWGDAVNFDGPGSDEVRAFFIDNALMWLRDYHFDGLRLDAVHAIYDMSALHFLEELRGRVAQLEAETGRRHVVIAESDLNDPRLVRAVDLGGYGLDAQWSDDFHHALHSVLTGERSGYYSDFGSLADLATTLRRGFRYAGEHSAYRGRRHGRFDPSLAGAQLLGYLQDHDQVGNRAMGERSSVLMSRGRLFIGAAVVLTAPFVPMLFMGEEWAASTPFQYFSDHADPELASAVSRGRRDEFAAFGWPADAVPDPQDPATFERSRLDWAEITREDHAEALAWHRALIQLRQKMPELTDGRLTAVDVDFDERAGWLNYRRGRLLVAFNLGAEPAALSVGAGGVVLAHGAVRLEAGTLSLGPDAVALVLS